MSDIEPGEMSDEELFEAYQHAKSQGPQFKLDEIQLEICERWEREVDSDDGRRMGDDVYVVFEDAIGKMATVRRAFDNETAAEAYVDDPDQLGNLFMVQLTLEATHE